MTDDEVANKAFEIAAEGGDDGRALFLVLYITAQASNADTEKYLKEHVLTSMPHDDQVRIKFWLQEHERASQIADVRTFVENRNKKLPV